MNLRQPYEQLIAHKLRKLPAPDADASWQQMKRLLDEDEDTRAGSKRNPGNGGGWWRIGIIVIILSASGWLYVKNSPTASNTIAKNKPTVSHNNQSSTIDKNTTPSASNSNTGSKKENKINAVATPTAIAAIDAINNTNASARNANKEVKDIGKNNIISID